MPKFILALDASQLYTFQVCPLQWYYRYKENLNLTTAHKKDAADAGTLIHDLLANYYLLRAQDPISNKLQQADVVVQKFTTEAKVLSLFPDTQETKELEAFLCKRFFLYVQRYMLDDFNVELKNNIAPIELGFSKLLYEDTYVKFIVEGRIDLLSNMQSLPCWVDHKTQSKNYTLYKYTPQFKTYAWATGYSYGMINYVGMQEDKDSSLLKRGMLFKRDLIYFTKEMIKEWECKMISIFFEIYKKLTFPAMTEEIFKLVRNDSSCAGAFNYNPCQYTYLCEEFDSEIKQKIKEFKYSVQEHWTPWKSE